MKAFSFACSRGMGDTYIALSIYCCIRYLMRWHLYSWFGARHEMELNNLEGRALFAVS